jgi:DNA-binding transcriptional MerR regulator
MSSYNQRGARSATGRARAALPERAFTSREAEQVSGVPFFTIDYWGRTRFLVPSIARGEGRGKGRQRMYSYGDLVRLRIARELREQKVSLETLRAILEGLAGLGNEIAKARFILVGSEVETATTTAELMKLLRRTGRRTFGVLLDLRLLHKAVRERSRALEAAGRGA